MTPDTADRASSAPRAGIAGVIDRVFGPGATRGELALALVPGSIAAALAPGYAFLLTVEWSLVGYLVAALLALDMVVGSVTTATASGRRWYHQPAFGTAAQLCFIAAHIPHLALVSWLFLDWNPYWVVAAGGWLLVSALAILTAAAHLRRPLAMLSYAVALAMALVVLPQPHGLEWFLPLFYLKLLVGHLSGA